MAGKVESGNSFKFIGKVSGNEKSFREHVGAHYTIASIRLNIECGTNRHFIECVGFKPKDTNKKLKYFYTDRTKGEVSYVNRMSIETDNLAFMHPSVKLFDNVSRFVSDYDFVLHLKNLLDTNKFNGINMFEVSGNIAYENYFDKNGKLVEVAKYRATQFVQVENGTEPVSTGIFNIYLGSDCFEKVGDVGILRGKSVIRNKNKDVDGIAGYDGYDTEIIIPLGDNQPDTVFGIYKKKYVGNDEAMNRIGIFANIINGVEEVEFDESMLTDEEKILIDLGMETLEDLKASKGVGKGNFKREIIRIREAKGYGDEVKESVLTTDELELLVKKNSVSGKEVFATPETTSDAPVPTETKNEELSGVEAFDDIF